jgi:universal stress protein A
MDTFLTRILVPTDFSETADGALDYARRLGDGLGASLHLLHVVQEPLLAEGVRAEVNRTAPPLADNLVHDARARLAERSPGTTSTECIVGDTVANIVATASRLRADLIIIGTNGRTGIAHLLLGSVAEHVVRMAPCPVVTIRRRAA